MSQENQPQLQVLREQLERAERTAQQQASELQQLRLELEEKGRQLAALQSHLVQAEKMAAIGTLVTGIAHEMNTPLGSIKGNHDILELAFQKVRSLMGRHSALAADPEALKETLSVIEEALRTHRMACDRALSLAGSLRRFARLDKLEHKKADIHESIETTLSLVAHELKHRIRVVKEFGSVPEIKCYPNQLSQVMMNIIVNACQAIENEGEIRIRTWMEGDALGIAISDNGSGIPIELHDKIFEPGFTTKGPSVGTGLGLSICRQIVQEHGGRIELESEVGHGSTFTIVLPCREAPEG